MTSIKPYFNERGWTDVHPFELVRVVSDKTVEIRAMDAVLDESWKPDFIPGGFFGHVANNSEQKWVITSNPQNIVFRIRKNKKGQWKNKYGTEYRNADEPRKFHDYNF